MKGCQYWHILKTFHCGCEYYLPRKIILTKIFWLADHLSQAILFFNSSLPSMVEQVFCSETDAVAFWVGVTAVTFSVVTMVTWQKQRSSFVLAAQLFPFHFLPGYHHAGGAALLVNSLILFSLGMSKTPCSAFLLSVSPGMRFWEQQHLAESVNR